MLKKSFLSYGLGVKFLLVSAFFITQMGYAVFEIPHNAIPKNPQVCAWRVREAFWDRRDFKTSVEISFDNGRWRRYEVENEIFPSLFTSVIFELKKLGFYTSLGSCVVSKPSKGNWTETYVMWKANPPMPLDLLSQPTQSEHHPVNSIEYPNLNLSISCGDSDEKEELPQF